MRCLAISVILLVFCAPAIADPTDEVRCREIAFSKSAETRNADAFRSFLDADARFVSSSVLRGPVAIAAAWAVFFKEAGPTIKWRPQVIEVLEGGTLALSRGPYRVITPDENGEPVEQWGTFNSVWRLHDDNVWRVVFDAGSPAASPPEESERALLDAEDNCS